MIYILARNLTKKSLSLLFLVFLIQCIHEEQIKQPENKVDASPKQIVTETKKPTKLSNESYTLKELFDSALQKTERIAIKKESIIQAEARKDSFFASFFPTLAFRYQQFVTTPNHSAHDREIRNRNSIINAYSNENYGTNISTPYDVSSSSSLLSSK